MKKGAIVGIFADPVGHTASPSMHNGAFRALGLDYVYKPFHVTPDALGAFVSRIRDEGWRGVNLTVPHKKAVIPLLDELSSEAERIGAVNTVVNDEGCLKGYNTDIFGFNEDLKQLCITHRGVFQESYPDIRCVLLGAGGAAWSVAAALCEKQIGQLTIVNRHIERAQQLSVSLEKKYHQTVIQVAEGASLKDIVQGSDWIVQSTSLGMKGVEGCLINADWMEARHLVYDLVYNPVETELIRRAKSRGATASNGLGMLVYQGARAFELWTGYKAPIDVMRMAAKKFVDEGQ